MRLTLTLYTLSSGIFLHFRKCNLTKGVYYSFLLTSDRDSNMILNQAITGQIFDALELNLILLPISGFAIFYSLFQRDRLKHWLNGYSIIWVITSTITYIFVPNCISSITNSSILALGAAFIIYATGYKKEYCWIPCALQCYFTVVMTLPLITKLEDLLVSQGSF